MGIAGLLIVLLLILANGFFVATEFALVSSRGTRIDQLASQGSRAARLPCAASWSMRVPREETSANSVATKNPFARISSRTISRPAIGLTFECTA